MPIETIPLLMPLMSMVALTLLVWLYMYFVRLSYILKHNINADDLHSPEALRLKIPVHVNKSANNLSNLFELPVLFYVLCIIALLLQISSLWLLYSAWGFVIFRTLHSIIHCTYNKVMHRFVAYLFGSLCLWTMVIIILDHIVSI